MNNVLKRMSHLLALSFVAVAGILSFSNARFSETLAASNQEPAVAEEAPASKQYSAADFAAEEEANSEEIGVSITQSNLTENSQSLSFTFRSKTVVGYQTAKKNYIVQIDDTNFGGEDNPASDDYERLDPESGLPIFDGLVLFVLGSSSSQNSDVYLPSTLTKAGKFIIQVNRIAAHAVTELGEEYHNKNTWNKITNIYIPDTITQVEAGAFTGFATAGEDTKIYYQGNSLPAGFEAGWTDAPDNRITCSRTSYKERERAAFTSGKVDDLEDELGRPINFILGCQKKNEPYRPLIVQYDKVVKENDAIKSRETIYEELPLTKSLTNTSGDTYDAVGPMALNSYSRLLSYRLAANEEIDDNSIYFHNIYKASKSSVIDTSKAYFVKAVISYGEKQHLSNLISYKASFDSHFAGFSMFSLTMDKNLSITSKKYSEPHSLYLDVKTEMYEQNKLKILEGKTKIRYSLYNLYNSSYHIQYTGKGGALKDIVVPIKTEASTLVLDHHKNNTVSILLKDATIRNMLDENGNKSYTDYAIEKVKLFELKDITVQMDLLATSDSGSVSVLGKSSIGYKFAYITVINTTALKVFNWDLFLIIFFFAYLVVYSAAAFGVYKYMKEKYKNDEFRRVNDKLFLKKAILGGLGLGEVLYAILFIVMRTTFFTSTIVVFNPTDPLLIAFSIVGMIIIGYFIVYLVKTIKVNNERKRILRLKLNEDVDDDGTK